MNKSIFPIQITIITKTTVQFILAMSVAQAIANIVPGLLVGLALLLLKVAGWPWLALLFWIVYSVGACSVFLSPMQLTIHSPE